MFNNPFQGKSALTNFVDEENLISGVMPKKSHLSSSLTQHVPQLEDTEDYYISRVPFLLASTQNCGEDAFDFLSDRASLAGARMLFDSARPSTVLERFQKPVRMTTTKEEEAFFKCLDPEIRLGRTLL
jgi:hypothetical protein